MLTRYLPALYLLVASLGAQAGTSAAHIERGMRFAAAVAVHDRHEARLGHEHVLAHPQDESAKELTTAVEHWLGGDAVYSTRFTVLDRLTLFTVYWAATMLPADSSCFVSTSTPACQADMAFWFGRVRSEDPDFVFAYAHASPALGLPPLAGSD